MAFDAFFMKVVLDELRQTADGARVEKIHQPSRDTVILHLRCQEGRQKLLLAANPASPRLHLTQTNPENPDQPPMFCMLLRKHLSGARLADIQQPPMERMARFLFDCTDEMGYPVQKQLVAELMGKTCNLYLLDSDGRILDCLRRVGLDESSRRAALPGLLYQPPEPVAKLDPETLTEEDFIKILDSLKINDKKVLLVVKEFDDNLVLASRNLANVVLISAEEINVLDIVGTDVMVITEEALNLVEEVLR